MQLSLLSLFVLAFLNVAFGAPVPVQDLERRASDLHAQEPVIMNIVKHQLDEPDVLNENLNSQRIMGHIKWLRELEEEEFMRREPVDASHFRVGIVVRN